MANPQSSVQNLGPLDWRIGIVDRDGRPTPEFQRRWNTQRNNNALIGTITTGDGPPTSTDVEQNTVYIDVGSTPYSFYVFNENAWHTVGVFDFTDLADVPHSYTGKALNFLQVKASVDGLDFISLTGGIDQLASSPARGDLLFRNATAWVFLAPSTAGNLLQTGGAGADPSYIAPSALPIFTSSVNGITPASGGGTTNFLRADGTWAVPAGSGGTPANPTATASDVAVNGSATTYMRSDAAPAVQKGSSSVFGLVKVDGTTITASSGVISAVGGGGTSSPTLPLVTGELPIAMISDPDGQAIAVPLGTQLASSKITTYLIADTIANRPASVNIATGATALFLATDTNVGYLWGGSAWVSI